METRKVCNENVQLAKWMRHYLQWNKIYAKNSIEHWIKLILPVCLRLIEMEVGRLRRDGKKK